MKNGLVMEGGALRGMFTAGILDVLMENGIQFDGAIGVSAGATFGINIKSKQIGRTVRYNLRFARDPRYCSFASLFLTGDLYGAEFCYRSIPDRLDPFDAKTFEENPMKFYVVATDIESGRAVYYDCKRGVGEDIEWIRGSASMPLVSRPVHVGGRLLLDGGITDSIPLRYMQHKGYEKNVVILTRPANYVKKSGPLNPLLKNSLKDYPAALKAMERRPEIYNKSVRYVRECEMAGNTFVIAPSEKLPISRITHNPQKIMDTWLIGREAAKEALPALKAFLGC